ncbi:hypothetical protein Pelo_18158 [Pelomyxa schiedti]|nr:hypothetical protein Pelo_18158 [Pelomyxa schiedti]
MSVTNSTLKVECTYAPQTCDPLTPKLRICLTPTLSPLSPSIAPMTPAPPLALGPARCEMRTDTRALTSDQCLMLDFVALLEKEPVRRELAACPTPCSFPVSPVMTHQQHSPHPYCFTPEGSSPSTSPVSSPMTPLSPSLYYLSAPRGVVPPTPTQSHTPLSCESGVFPARTSIGSKPIVEEVVLTGSVQSHSWFSPAPQEQNLLPELAKVASVAKPVVPPMESDNLCLKPPTPVIRAQQSTVLPPTPVMEGNRKDKRKRRYETSTKYAFVHDANSRARIAELESQIASEVTKHKVLLNTHPASDMLPPCLSPLVAYPPASRSLLPATPTTAPPQPPTIRIVPANAISSYGSPGGLLLYPSKAIPVKEEYLSFQSKRPRTATLPSPKPPPPHPAIPLHQQPQHPTDPSQNRAVNN